jgi:hypothetical protein
MYGQYGREAGCESLWVRGQKEEGEGGVLSFSFIKQKRVEDLLHYV